MTTSAAATASVCSAAGGHSCMLIRIRRWDLERRSADLALRIAESLESPHRQRATREVFSRHYAIPPHPAAPCLRQDQILYTKAPAPAVSILPGWRFRVAIRGATPHSHLWQSKAVAR